MVLLGNKQKSFCQFWDCTQVLQFGLLLTMRLLHFFEGKGFLPTVVDTMVIWIKLIHSSPFKFTDPKMSMFCHFLCDHFQFTLIHGPNIPSSYATLFFAASDITSITSHIHNCFFFFFSLWLDSSFFLKLFLRSSSVAYWAPTDLGSSSFSVICFCLFILFMGFSRQEYWSGLPFPSPVDHILSDCWSSHEEIPPHPR